MKYSAISFLVCCLFTGCTSRQQLSSSSSLDQKDRIFESYLIKKFNEINRLKNRTKIVEIKNEKMKRDDIFYQQIHGGKL